MSFGLSILVPIPGNPGAGTRRARVARLRREPQGIISAATEPQGLDLQKAPAEWAESMDVEIEAKDEEKISYKQFY